MLGMSFMKEAAAHSVTILIPFMKGAGGPLEKMHISCIKWSAALYRKIEIPFSKEAAGMLGMSFMKEAAAHSVTILIPFMKGAARPFKKNAYILYERGGRSVQ